MNKRKNIFSTAGVALMGALLAISAGSCKDNEAAVTVPDEFEVINDGDKDSVAIITVSTPTAILGNAAMDEGLSARFTNITAPENAQVLIVDGADLDAYEDVLLNGYNRNAIIVVNNSDEESTLEWSDRNGLDYGGKIGSSMTTGTIYGFNRKGQYYFQEKRTVDELIDDDDVPLNSFTTWVNNTINLRMTSNPRSFNIAQRFMGQTFNQTLTLSLDPEALKADGWSAPEGTPTQLTADLKLTVYPLHVFTTPGAGDVYFVTADLTVHNADIFSGQWQRKRGNTTSTMGGYYMSGCTFGARLRGAHSFRQGCEPVPATTAEGAEYATGFKWGETLSLTGGLNDGKNAITATAEGNWTWDNTKTFTADNLAIALSTIEGNPSFTATIPAPLGEDMQPVAAAKGDFTFSSSWAWYVDNSAISGDRQAFIAELSVVPVLQGYIQTDGVTEVYNWTASNRDNGTVAFRLIPPTRKQSGTVTLTYAHPTLQYTSDIEFWENEIPATGGHPLITLPQRIISSMYPSGVGINATRALMPEGPIYIRAKRFNLNGDGTRYDEVTVVTPQPVMITANADTPIDLGSDIFVEQ